MNIKKFFKKTFPSFSPFKTTPRTYEVLEEARVLNQSFFIIVYIYVKDRLFGIAYPENWTGQDSKTPCFNFKRKLIEGVYEAEVAYEGDLLPYIAVLNRCERALVLIPDSEEGMESLSIDYKNRIMPFMLQIQQAKELIALNEAMKTGVQHD